MNFFKQRSQTGEKKEMKINDFFLGGGGVGWGCES